MVCGKYENAFKMARLSIADAKHKSSHFSIQNILEIAQNQTSSSIVKMDISNAGVTFQKLELRDTGEDYYKNTGFVKGKEAIENVKKKFKDLTELIVKIASLKMSFTKINQIRKSTNSTANSLEFSIIPKLEKTVSYIVDVLEEQEREDLFRIKVFKKSEIKKKEKNEELVKIMKSATFFE
ncbi:MAG: V-type proton ATPase subunit D [Paramarteilia canceri]